MRPIAPGRARAGWWLALVLLLPSGCLSVPQPLLYGAQPVAAGHVRVQGAVGAGVMPSEPTGIMGYHALPLPGVAFSARTGLGPAASLGVGVSLGGVGVDGRVQLLHTPRLSLSLGLTLGVGIGVASMPDTLGPPVPLFVGSLPVVLAWHVQGGTLLFGLRPGLRGVPGALNFIGTTHFAAVPGIEPLAGALLGLDAPITDHLSLQLEVDVTRSFVNPGTVTTLSLGIRN